MPAKKQFLRLERLSNQGGGKWEERFTEKARQFICFGATDEVLALAFDVSLSTISKWKRDYPEFLEAVNNEKLKVDTLIGFAFYRCATGYEYKEKRITNHANGTVTEETFIKHQPGNAWAQLKWLQLRQREIWGEDKGMGTGNTTININNLNQINMDALNNEELKLALKLGMQKSIGTGE